MLGAQEENFAPVIAFLHKHLGVSAEEAQVASDLAAAAAKAEAEAAAAELAGGQFPETS